MGKRGLILVIYLLVLFSGFYFGSYYSYSKLEQQKINDIEASLQSKGWQLYFVGSYDAAIEEFKSYLGRDNKNFIAYSGLGWSHYQNQNYPEAINAFKKATELNIGNYDPYSGLAWSYYLLGDYGSAINAFNKAVELRPDVLTVYSGLGRSYFKIKEYDKAAEAFKKVLSIDPNLIFPAAGLFLISYENGDTAEADSYLSRIIPFRYDSSIQADKNYRLFGNCMSKINTQDAETAKIAYECGRLI